MTVRMRHTKGHMANRRSHHALSEPRLSTCPDCNASHVRHTACNACGRYRGRVVIDVAAKALKQEKKAKARRAEALRTGGADSRSKSETDKADESNPKALNAEALSKAQ